MVQIGRRPDSRPDDYRKTRKSILEIVKRINRKWGGPIVYFETAQMPLSDRMAFYALGDVMLTTEVRSGFNPAGFEFLVAQRARASLPQLRVHGDEHEAAVRRRDVLQLPGVVELLGVARPGPLLPDLLPNPLTVSAVPLNRLTSMGNLSAR